MISPFSCSAASVLAACDFVTRFLRFAERSAGSSLAGQPLAPLEQVKERTGAVRTVLGREVRQHLPCARGESASRQPPDERGRTSSDASSPLAETALSFLADEAIRDECEWARGREMAPLGLARSGAPQHASRWGSSDAPDLGFALFSVGCLRELQGTSEIMKCFRRIRSAPPPRARPSASSHQLSSRTPLQLSLRRISKLTNINLRGSSVPGVVTLPKDKMCFCVSSSHLSVTAVAESPAAIGGGGVNFNAQRGCFRRHVVLLRVSPNMRRRSRPRRLVDEAVAALSWSPSLERVDIAKLSSSSAHT